MKAKVKNINLDIELYTKLGIKTDLEFFKQTKKEYEIKINRLDRAMNGLSELERDLIEKRFIYRMKIKDIEKEFKILVKTIYNKINSGLNKMMEYI